MHKKKLIISLLTLHLLFFIVFVIGFVNLMNGRAVFHIGIPYIWEDLIVMGFSVLSMINTIVELVRV